MIHNWFSFSPTVQPKTPKKSLLIGILLISPWEAREAILNCQPTWAPSLPEQSNWGSAPKTSFCTAPESSLRQVALNRGKKNGWELLKKRWLKCLYQIDICVDMCKLLESISKTSKNRVNLWSSGLLILSSFWTSGNLYSGWNSSLWKKCTCLFNKWVLEILQILIFQLRLLKYSIFVLERPGAIQVLRRNKFHIKLDLDDCLASTHPGLPTIAGSNLFKRGMAGSS